MAEELKKKMLRAKDASKKSEQFLAKLERNNFNSEPPELIEMDSLLNLGKEHCEFCVNQLMSDEIGAIISNKEELLNKMLQYQE